MAVKIAIAPIFLVLFISILDAPDSPTSHALDFVEPVPPLTL